MTPPTPPGRPPGRQAHPPASLYAARTPAPSRPASPLGALPAWLTRRPGRWSAAGALSLLLAAALVAGLSARSQAETRADTGGPPPGPPSLLPTSVPLPPLALPGLPAVQLPPISLPPVTLPGSPAAPAPPAPAGITAYTGLSGWLDLYHYGAPGDDAPATVVAAMAAHGVRTLYIETARWNSPAALDHPGAVGDFLDAAHASGLRMVGWYMPGFADVARDVARSVAVMDFASPGGQHFDGFAADIEDRSATRSQDQFNAGIAAYAQAVRAGVPDGTTLGAIVPDARNNQRAPAHWAGFPWPAIGDNFDVVLPMAYWSVTKASRTCLATQMDVAAYINLVIDLTDGLMGRNRPIAPMGGIASCDTTQEVAQYVATLRARGALGGGLYDFYALEANPHAGTLWSELAGLNG